MASPRKGERGHLLVGLMIWVAILMIFSTVATQAWVDVLRRDNEAEMIFRAQEIVRALKKYQKDRGTLPTTLDQLIEPGSRGQYFLRRLYKDPLTKSGKWILLYSGPDGSVIDATIPAATETEGLGESKFGKAPPPLAGPGGNVHAGSGELGGLPIAGVKTACTDQPFRVYKDQTDYKEWKFTILDLQAPQGQVPGQPGQPGQTGPQGQQPPRQIPPPRQ